MTNNTCAPFYGTPKDVRCVALNIAKTQNHPVSIFLLGPGRYVLELYNNEDQSLEAFLETIQPESKGGD